MGGTTDSQPVLSLHAVSAHRLMVAHVIIVNTISPWYWLSAPRSHPQHTSLTCASLGTPPYTQAVRSPVSVRSVRHCCATCSASSRVGTRTSSRGPSGCVELSWPASWRRGEGRACLAAGPMSFTEEWKCQRVRRGHSSVVLDDGGVWVISSCLTACVLVSDQRSQPVRHLRRDPEGGRCRLPRQPRHRHKVCQRIFIKHHGRAHGQDGGLCVCEETLSTPKY